MDRALASHPAPGALLVTGSYCTGQATPSSDLELPAAPASWRDDLPLLLGLEEASGQEIVEATRRLGLELLAFLRENVPGVDPQPGIAEAPADGTLERLLAETVVASP